MAQMRPPHILQFLGSCYLEGSALPLLVMEQLDNGLGYILAGKTETGPGPGEL